MPESIPKLTEVARIPHETHALWLYEPDGEEPAFDVRFSYDGDEHAWHMTVTPMHMDGSDAESVTIIAR